MNVPIASSVAAPATVALVGKLLKHFAPRDRPNKNRFVFAGGLLGLAAAAFARGAVLR